MDSVLQGQVANKIMERKEGLERLTRIGRFSLKDVATFNRAGWKFKDESELTEEQVYCISELSKSKEGLKIKTHSAVEAIKQLRAMQGWDKPARHELTGADGKDLKSEVTVDSVAKKMLLLLGMAAHNAERGRGAS